MPTSVDTIFFHEEKAHSFIWSLNHTYLPFNQRDISGVTMSCGVKITELYQTPYIQYTSCKHGVRCVLKTYRIQHNMSMYHYPLLSIDRSLTHNLELYNILLK